MRDQIKSLIEQNIQITETHSWSEPFLFNYRLQEAHTVRQEVNRKKLPQSQV